MNGISFAGNCCMQYPATDYFLVQINYMKIQELLDVEKPQAKYVMDILTRMIARVSLELLKNYKPMKI